MTCVKTIFIYSDKNSYDKIAEYKKVLEKHNFRIETLQNNVKESSDYCEKLSREELRLKTYRLIRNCDITYILLDNNIDSDNINTDKRIVKHKTYVKRSIIDVISYAYTCNKELLTSRSIRNKCVRELVSGVMNLEQLAGYNTT